MKLIIRTKNTEIFYPKTIKQDETQTGGTKNPQYEVFT